MKALATSNVTNTMQLHAVVHSSLISSCCYVVLVPPPCFNGPLSGTSSPDKQKSSRSSWVAHLARHISFSNGLGTQDRNATLGEILTSQSVIRFSSGGDVNGVVLGGRLGSCRARDRWNHDYRHR